MTEHHIIERRIISDAVLKGSNFLLNMQNEDGGIEFEDEKSERSGIWVTAEALEFFLSSQIVPITICEKVIGMINFLLNTQNTDGSWNMLAPTGNNSSDNSSIIATGHCIYVLRLAISDAYMPQAGKIDKAILKAEEWLLDQKIEKNKKIYWAEGAKKEANPDKDAITRMEVVFTSFYALMGLISNANGFGKHRPLSKAKKNILKKIAFCFEEEAKWFINQYQSKVKALSQQELAKILSTFSRITNAIFWLDNELDDNSFERVKDGLLTVISNGRENGCFTTPISVGTLDDAGGYNKIYNNNTPFDVSMALLRLEDDVETIVMLLNEYLNNQMSDGSWFLNFSETYKIKTWSTAEALICLEQAFEKYDIIATVSMEKYWQQKISEVQSRLEQVNNEKQTLEAEKDVLSKKLTKAKEKGRVFTILIIVMVIVGGILAVKWLTDPANAGSSTYNLFALFIIPFAIGILVNPFWNWLAGIIHQNSKQ